MITNHNLFQLQMYIESYISQQRLSKGLYKGISSYLHKIL